MTRTPTIRRGSRSALAVAGIVPLLSLVALPQAANAAVPGAGWTASVPQLPADSTPPSTVELAAVTGTDGTIYAIGGRYSADVYALAPGAAQWTAKPPLPAATAGLAAAATNGTIYAIGGYTSNGATAAVYALPSGATTWLTASDGIPQLPTAAKWLAATTGTDGTIYAIGGNDDSGGTTNVYALAPSATAWTTKASLPTATDELAAATGSDGTIYAIGGLNGGYATDAVEAYNPASNTWAAVAPLPTATHDLASVAGPDGRIYALGGDQTDTAEVYDPHTRAWTAIGPMPAVAGSAGAALGPDGRVYSIGGYDSTEHNTTQVAAYTPTRTISSSQLSLTFDGTDPERVTSLTWTPNGSANYVAEGGGTCSGSNDPVEFFGQSYGDAGNLVVRGQTGTWSSTGTTAAISSVASPACSNSTVHVSTGYAIDDSPAYANEVQVTRTFQFGQPTTPETGSLRGYVPRLPVSTYPDVLYPSTQGGIATTDTSGDGAVVTGWDASKRWFADDNGSGTGMLVLRDPTDTLTAQLLADSDNYSSSNNSDIALLAPTGGWTGDQTETEYLCFYDPTTWTSTAQGAGDLPTGCGAAVTAPGSPSITSATPGDRSMKVAFDAPTSNGGATITSYTVTAHPHGTPDSTHDVTASGPASPITVNALTGGQKYDLSVVATNIVGPGPASPVVSATPLVAPAFTADSPPLVGTVGSPYGPYTFVASGTPTPTYSLASGALPPGLTLTTAGTLSGTPTAAAPATFTVSASNGVAPVATSGSLTITIAPAAPPPPPVGPTVPGAPSAVTAVGGDAEASVIFSAPTYDGSAVITGYVIVPAPACPACTGLSPASTSSTVTGLTNGTAYTFTVRAVNSAGVGPPSPPSNSVTPRPAFTSTGPVRILDTLHGIGAPKAPVGPKGTIILTVPNLPAGTTAVVLNLTGTGLTGAATTFVSGCPAAQPLAACTATSVLNTVTGTTANEITVPVGPDGRITLYNNAGHINLVADLVGYQTGGYATTGPTRILDTRRGLGAPKAPVGPKHVITVTVPNLPAGTTAVVLNLTGTGLTGAETTFVSACPTTQLLAACTATSALNAVPGVAVANEITVPVATDGKIRLYNNAGSIDLVADLVGYQAGGLTVTGPTRILDTRQGVGVPKGPLGPKGTVTMTVPNLPAGTTAVVLNLTGTRLFDAPQTFVSACPAAIALADCTKTSVLNVIAGQDVANEITVPVGPDGKITLYNNAGTIDLVADLAGYYVPSAPG